MPPHAFRKAPGITIHFWCTPDRSHHISRNPIMKNAIIIIIHHLPFWDATLCHQLPPWRNRRAQRPEQWTQQMMSLRNNIVFLLLEEQERYSGAACVPLAPAGHAVLSHARLGAWRWAFRVGSSGAAVFVVHPASRRTSGQTAEVELELLICEDLGGGECKKNFH